MTQMAHFMNETTDLGFGLDMLYLYYSTLMTTVLAATALRPQLWPFYGLWSICQHLPLVNHSEVKTMIGAMIGLSLIEYKNIIFFVI